MYWALFTLLAISSRSAYSLATKVLTNQLQASAGVQNFLLTGAATLLGLAISPWLGGIDLSDVNGHWLAAIIMMTCSALGGVTFFKGQRHLDASTTQIAFSSILLWGVGLSIGFLGSHFSPKQAVGIVLLFAAIILIQYRKGKRRLDAGILWVILSAALFSVFQVASAKLSKYISGGTYLLLAYGGPTVIVGLMYARNISRELPQLTHRLTHSLRAVLFAALTSFGYYVFTYLAYRDAPDPGVVVVLLTSQVVLSVLMGIILLRERQDVPRKLLAGLLAFIAGMLIKSS